jgi:type I restriction-modification system DNA methylase subunit
VSDIFQLLRGVDESIPSNPPRRLRDLVSTFRDNIEEIKNQQVEASTRVDFINPFLEELGWDVKNASGKPPSKRDVVYEPRVTIDGSSKAPDYALCVDGEKKIYVEAKRVSEDLAQNRNHAYQLRRYSWNAGLPFGVLTDFEELAIYDCRHLPLPEDDASVARIGYLKFSEFENKWASLEQLLSQSAIESGSLERLLTNSLLEKGTLTIDQSFLEFMRRWRSDIAQNVAIKNLQFDETQIDYETQSLLNKIIFLRILEDRGLESPNAMLQLAQNEDNALGKLKIYFSRANDRYNSGLFSGLGLGSENLHQSGLDLIIDDGLLCSFIKALYYPNPYEFSVMPADILGQIYEVMLAEDVTIVNAKTREIEVNLKPEVKKKGGVFYTPTPIVEYIIEETVGPLIEKKTPKQLLDVKIVDPACGSGTFLVSAFQYLLDYVTDFYAKEQPKKLQIGADGTGKISIDERRKILESCIYGVDIDAQAVEVAKLSLLLKLVENESQYQFEFGHILPNLNHNLQSGNSLIGDDFQQAMFSFHFDSSFNPFSWKKAFPEVFQNGGFDAVIGNPPYLNVDDVWGKKDPRLTYLKTHYPHIHTDKTDILFYFLEKAVQICKGEIGMIVSRSFLEADKATKLRKWLAENAKIREVLDFRKAEVFKGVGINTAIINITGSKHVNKTIFKKWRKELLPAGYRAATLRIEENLELLEVDCQKLTGDIWNFGAENVEKIIMKMDSAGTPLSTLATVGQGMQTGANSEFEIDEELYEKLKGKNPLYVFPRFTNSGIKRFKLDKPKKFLIYPEEVKKLKDLPGELVEVIEKGKKTLQARAAFKRGNCDWWKFTWPLHKDLFQMPKIVSPYMAERNTFAVDESNYGMYLTDTTVIYVTDKNIHIHALCALLNSEIMDFRFHYLTKLKGGGVKEYFAKQVEKLPIPFTTSNKELIMNLDDLGLRRAQSELVLESTQLEKEKSQVLQVIQQLDRQIEVTVASMFGLSEDEHSVVMNTKSQWS